MAGNTIQILVVGGEVGLARALGRALEALGFVVVLASDGPTGHLVARERVVDLILLDVVLPGRSGRDVLRQLRSEGSRVPILVLTTEEEPTDEADALEAGADDYLRQPFTQAVFIARCRALLRRGRSGESVDIAVDGLVLNPRRRTARRGDALIRLSRRESSLLEYLMRNVGRACSREEILTDVWGDCSSRTPNLVEVYIGYLRRKVDRPFRTSTVHTVRGKGYMARAQP